MRKYLLHVLIISFVFIVIPITSATGGSKSLRSHYGSLSLSQVKSMANVSIRQKKDWGFKGHSTINHDYNPEIIRGDVVVVDDATGLMWHQNGSDKYMGQVNVLGTSFYTVLEKVGVENLWLHDLRHTFATRLAQADVDLYKISKLLGHKNIRTTQRYAHHCPDSLRDGVEISESDYNG